MTSTTSVNRGQHHAGAKVVALCFLSAAMAACGGGGGGGVSSTPPPPAAPPPPPPPPPLPASSSSVSIFPDPTPGEYSSVGVRELSNGALSTADSDQLHVRYNSGGYYEIQMPGRTWSKLQLAPIEGFPGRMVPTSGLGREIVISESRTQGFTHSELAFWYDNGTGGYIAFGPATPSSQIPVTGSATYNGIISGSSDVLGVGDMGGSYDVPVTGTVQLSFDFGNGTLGGSMTATLSPYFSNSTSLGTFTFADTVYSAGSTHYSGQFNTSVSGDNYFLGQFAGPNAKETIGAWALPFVFSGSNHQAFGAWIAKR